MLYDCMLVIHVNLQLISANANSLSSKLKGWCVALRKKYVWLCSCCVWWIQKKMVDLASSFTSIACYTCTFSRNKMTSLFQS